MFKSVQKKDGYNHLNYEELQKSYGNLLYKKENHRIKKYNMLKKIHWMITVNLSLQRKDE